MTIKRLLPVFILLVFFVDNTIAQLKQPIPTAYATDAATLAANKKKIKAGKKSILPAYRQLMLDAEKALAYQPVSVMEKAKFPPSGNKHDYMSIAPYFWPDSTKPGGSPYINRDGEINPEVKQYMDKIYLSEVCENVSTLSLAWYFSGDAKYAEHAGKLLRVWFLDTATRMNPNLNFAQAITGRTTGRGFGLIDTRHFVKLVDALNLLKKAETWTNNDQAGMKDWFAQFLNWMQTSKNGLEEMHTTNNHGVWYDQQRLAFALFCGDTALAKKVVESAKARLDQQMDDEGGFPLEMKRTISLHYTVFIIDPFFTIAQLAQSINIDLWNYTTPSGKSLKKGFTVLLPYLLKEKTWTGPQILPFEYEEALPLLVRGAEKYKCACCKKGIRAIMGDDKANILRFHLLAGTDF